MKMERMKLVTIIAESALEGPVIDELKKNGVKGYTAMEARGEGRHGARMGDWEQSRNVRLEVLCAPAQAEAIVRRLMDAYARHYAMVVYVSDVDLARPEEL